MKLVWDAGDCELEFMGIRIVARPADSAPFSIQAVVEEEDTYRVLGNYHEMSPPTQTTKKLVTEMLNEQAVSPGSVITTGKFPKRLLAIVHNLEQEPSWRVDWVLQALQECMRIIGREGFQSIAIPILGGVHGKISSSRFIKMLANALEEYQPGALRKIWLVLPEGENCRVLSPLKRG